MIYIPRLQFRILRLRSSGPFQFAQPGAHFLGVHQFSALRCRVALFYLRGNLRSIFSEPCFPIMEFRNSMLHEFLHAPIRAALHAPLNELLNQGPKVNFHKLSLLFAAKKSQPVPHASPLLACMGLFKRAAHSSMTQRADPQSVNPKVHASTTKQRLGPDFCILTSAFR